MNIIELPHGFSPREYQRVVYEKILVEGVRHSIIIWHRRAGKTISLLNLITALAHKRVGLHLYTFPQLRQGKKVVWNGADYNGRRYLDYIPKELVKRKDNSEMLLEFKNGSILQLVGTDRYDSIMGTNPVSIIYDEYSLQNPQARTYLRPILSENDGVEIFCYTPRGKNHGYHIYNSNKNNPEWFVTKAGANETKRADGKPVFDAEEIQRMRNEGMPEEVIQQEFYCSFDVEMPGSVFGSWINKAEKDKRVRKIPIEKSLPVFTWWDIGWNDDTVIVFMQPFGGELRFVHCYNNRKQDIPHYANYIKDFEEEHGVKCKYHFPPHDINVHEWGSGRTRFHIAHDNGIYFQPPVKKMDHTDGREALRSVLVRCHFDAERCEMLLNALRDYHYDYDDKKGLYKDRPIHDWSSHFADTMMYFAITWQQYFEKESAHKNHTYRY